MKEVRSQSGILKTCALFLSLEAERFPFLLGFTQETLGKYCTETQSSEGIVEPVWENKESRS